MINLGILVSLLSVLTGTFLLGIIVSILFWTKTIILKYYFLFVLTLYLFSLAILIEKIFILPAAEIQKFFSGLIWLLQASASLLFISTSPFFFFRLFNIKLNSTIKLILISVDIIAIISALIYLLIPSWNFITYILNILIFGTLFWETLFILVNLFSLKDKTLKKAVIILISVTIVFIPILLADYIISMAPYFSYLSKLDNLGKPIYLLVISFLGVIFTLHYFNRPGFRKNNELTDFFIQKFKITNREKEIIQCIINGHNNKTISETLFIASKTVENHISSIYQKTSVKNRIQLAQKIFNNTEN